MIVHLEGRPDRSAARSKDALVLLLAVLLSLSLLAPTSALAGPIALGFDGFSAEPHPPIAGIDDTRQGMGFAAAPDGDTAVLYGGRFGGSPLAESDTWIWNGESWEPQCGAPEAPAPCGPGPRAFAGMATAPDGVLLYGGTNQGIDVPGATVLGDAWLWRDGVWTEVCNGCPPGRRAGAAMAGNGEQVLLFGGFEPQKKPTDELWIFDGETWTLAEPSDGVSPPSRIGGHLAWDGEKFVLFGGALIPTENQPDIPHVIADTWTWDGEKWTQICGEANSCGPEARFLGGFAFLDNPDVTRRGALLVGGFFLRLDAEVEDDGEFGDERDDFPEFFGDLWFWDGATWIELGSPWTGGLLEDDNVLLPSLPAFPALASRPAACEVSLVAAFPDGFEGENPRIARETFDIGFDADRDGAPDVCPDEGAPESPVAALAFEQAATDGPILAIRQDTAFRFLPGFAGTPSGEGLFYGGIFLGDVQTPHLAEDDTWLWDGAEWTPLCGTSVPGADEPCAPGPRSMHALASGPDGVVLYGGSEAAGPTAGYEGAQSDAFVWSESEGWVPLCTDCPPGPRLGAAMAGNGETILLFSGATGPGELLRDTWLFDGTSWTQVDDGENGGPEPRIAGQLAWDGAHFVLFSGLTLPEPPEQPSEVAPDTWIWDDGAWVRACEGDACGPPARGIGAFSYLASPDPMRRGALLVGGIQFDLGSGFEVRLPNVLGDVWLWDGLVWSRLGSPFVNRIVHEYQREILVPAFGVAAARPDECSVALLAVVPVGETARGAVPEERTWNVGFDVDHDGHGDPCPPAPTPSPSPAPTPVASKTPHASATPRVTTTSGPRGEGLRRPIARGGPFVPRGLAP